MAVRVDQPVDARRHRFAGLAHGGAQASTFQTTERVAHQRLGVGAHAIAAHRRLAVALDTQGRGARQRVAAAVTELTQWLAARHVGADGPAAVGPDLACPRAVAGPAAGDPRLAGERVGVAIQIGAAAGLGVLADATGIARLHRLGRGLIVATAVPVDGQPTRQPRRTGIGADQQPRRRVALLPTHRRAPIGEARRHAIGQLGRQPTRRRLEKVDDLLKTRDIELRSLHGALQMPKRRPHDPLAVRHRRKLLPTLTGVHRLTANPRIPLRRRRRAHRLPITAALGIPRRRLPLHPRRRPRAHGAPIQAPRQQASHESNEPAADQPRRHLPSMNHQPPQSRDQPPDRATRRAAPRGTQLLGAGPRSGASRTRLRGDGSPQRQPLQTHANPRDPAVKRRGLATAAPDAPRAPD